MHKVISNELSSTKDQNGIKNKEDTSSREADDSAIEDEDEEEDEDEDDEMDFVDDERVEDMEKMNFEFEAFPPDDCDIGGIQTLLQQIFLRAEIDIAGLAKEIVDQSPRGCVYKPAEEYEDQDGDADSDSSIVYGVLSMVGLNGKKKFQTNVVELVLQRAKKFASANIYKQFKNALSGIAAENSEQIGLLINERFLHFPAQISSPAFASLMHDYNSLPRNKQPQQVVIILKVRICFDKNQSAMAKGKKKELLAAKMAEADIIYDNPEEQLLVKSANSAAQFPAFYYPVESEVEKGSKFHCIRRSGQIYRPYRAVYLLSREQFLHFAKAVANSTDL